MTNKKKTVNTDMMMRCKQLCLLNHYGYAELFDYFRATNNLGMHAYASKNGPSSVLILWLMHHQMYPCDPDDVEEAQDMIMEHYPYPDYEYQEYPSPCDGSPLFLPVGIYDDPNLTKFSKKHRSEARKAARGDRKNDRKPVPCVCIDNGMEFRSFSAAGKWAGTDGRLVADCCYGVRDSVKDHHFALKRESKQDYGEKEKAI